MALDVGQIGAANGTAMSLTWRQDLERRQVHLRNYLN